MTIANHPCQGAGHYYDLTDAKCHCGQTEPPRLVPNLIGLWVWSHDLVPRTTPPDVWCYDGRYWINTADVEAFHRWAASKARKWRYQDDDVMSMFGMPRRRS